MDKLSTETAEDRDRMRTGTGPRQGQTVERDRPRTGTDPEQGQTENRDRLRAETS